MNWIAQCVRECDTKNSLESHTASKGLNIMIYYLTTMNLKLKFFGIKYHIASILLLSWVDTKNLCPDVDFKDIPR